jgi:hypothetical protein
MKNLFTLFLLTLFTATFNQVYCPPPLQFLRTTLPSQKSLSTIEITTQTTPLVSHLKQEIIDESTTATAFNVDELDESMSEFLPDQILSLLNPKLMSPFMAIFALIKNFIEKVLLILGRL